MKLIKNDFSTAYEKIRKHILTHVAKAGDSPMRLASSREMAKIFKVTQTTVARVLKDLASDGFLSVKQGIGAFTIPGKLAYPKDVLLIGLLHGDGRHVFPVRSHWILAAAFAEELLSRSLRYQIQDYFISEKDFVKELSGAGLDALVWIFPHIDMAPRVSKLKKAGIPVLVIGRAVPGVSCVYMDHRDDNLQVARMMLARGRRRILLARPDREKEAVEADAVEGLKEALAEKGVPFDPAFVIRHSPQDSQGFQRALLRLRPDAIIFNTDIGLAWNAIRECEGVLPDCLLYANAWAVFRDMGFSGILGVPDLRPAFKAGADNLLAQALEKAKAPVINERLRMKLLDESGAKAN